MACRQEVAERLGAKISELCSYIYAAEHRLLTLIREFDEQGALIVKALEMAMEKQYAGKAVWTTWFCSAGSITTWCKRVVSIVRRQQAVS